MPEEKAAQESKVCLGIISGAHGIRGEVKIKAFGDDPLEIGSYGPLSDESGTTTVEVSAARPTKGGVIARIAGISDRNQAETLKGLKLFVERSTLPAPEEDEYYHADLVGMRVELEDGRPVGAVIAVQDYGAGAMLEIRPSEPIGAGMRGEETLLVPFNREVVPEVDLPAGRIVLDPPPGLLDGPAQPPRRGRGRGPR